MFNSLRALRHRFRGDRGQDLAAGMSTVAAKITAFISIGSTLTTYVS